MTICPITYEPLRAKEPGPYSVAGLHRLLAHVAAVGVTQVAVPVASEESGTLVDVEGTLWQA